MDTVTLSAKDYQDLIDARDHAVVMRDVVSGTMPVLTAAEAELYLDCASPLAFWRHHRHFTQAQLGALIGVSQAYVAQLETGVRSGDVRLFARIADILKVRIEDLLAD